MAYRHSCDRYTAIIMIVSVYLVLVIAVSFNYFFRPQVDMPLEHYYVEYTVQQGDSLWDIASDFDQGDTAKLIQRIKRDNGLVNDVLMPGQKLLVPVPEIRD